MSFPFSRKNTSHSKLARVFSVGLWKEPALCLAAPAVLLSLVSGGSPSSNSGSRKELDNKGWVHPQRYWQLLRGEFCGYLHIDFCRHQFVPLANKICFPMLLKGQVGAYRSFSIPKSQHIKANFCIFRFNYKERPFIHVVEKLHYN